MGNPYARPPKCYLRMDYGHLMKAVSRWSIMRSDQTDRRVKEFYMRGIAFMANSTNFDHIKLVFRGLLISAMASNDRTSISTGEASRCEIEKKALKKLYSTGNFELDEYLKLDQQKAEEKDENEDKDHESVFENLRDEKISNIDEWVEKTLQESIELTLVDDGDHENLMYKKAIISHLTDLMKRFPVWTCSMTEIHIGTGHGGGKSSGATTFVPNFPKSSRSRYRLSNKSAPRLRAALTAPPHAPQPSTSRDNSAAFPNAALGSHLTMKPPSLWALAFPNEQQPPAPIWNPVFSLTLNSPMPLDVVITEGTDTLDFSNINYLSVLAEAARQVGESYQSK